MSIKRLARSSQQSRDSIATHPPILPIPIIGKDEITLWQEPNVVSYKLSGAWSLHAAVPSSDTYVNFLRDTTTNQEYREEANPVGFAGTASQSDSTGSSEAYFPQGDDWVNPSNATGDTTGTNATSDIQPEGESDFLELTNFGFSIPSASVILGVKARVEWEAEATKVRDGRMTGNTPNGKGIQLIVGGSRVGDNDKAKGTSATTKQFYEYGGEADLWGNSLSASDVNASDFGLSLVYCNTQGLIGGTAGEARVHRVELTVYYEDTSNAPGLLVSQTTGALDLTNNRIDLDSGDSVEWICAKGLKGVNNIVSATPVIDTNADRTNASFSASAGATFPYTFPITFSTTGISLSLSADGGANWQAANNGETITFTNPGTELRMRWTSSAAGQYWKTADSDGYEVPITVTFTTN